MRVSLFQRIDEPDSRLRAAINQVIRDRVINVLVGKRPRDDRFDGHLRARSRVRCRNAAKCAASAGA